LRFFWYFSEWSLIKITIKSVSYTPEQCVILDGILRVQQSVCAGCASGEKLYGAFSTFYVQLSSTLALQLFKVRAPYL